MSPGTSWNDGPGASSRRSLRVGLTSKIDVRDGHWVWTGPLNFAGAPMMLIGGRAQSAHLVAWEAFRGHSPLGLSPLCDERMCVRPDHWGRMRSPAKPKPEKRARPARKAAKPIEAEPEKAAEPEPAEKSARPKPPKRVRKDTCRGGHDLTATAERYPSGKPYCRGCEADRQRTPQRVEYMRQRYKARKESGK